MPSPDRREVRQREWYGFFSKKGGNLLEGFSRGRTCFAVWWSQTKDLKFSDHQMMMGRGGARASGNSTLTWLPTFLGPLFENRGRLWSQLSPPIALPLLPHGVEQLWGRSA